MEEICYSREVDNIAKDGMTLRNPTIRNSLPDIPLSILVRTRSIIIFHESKMLVTRLIVTKITPYIIVCFFYLCDADLDHLSSTCLFPPSNM